MPPIRPNKTFESGFEFQLCCVVEDWCAVFQRHLVQQILEMKVKMQFVKVSSFPWKSVCLEPEVAHLVNLGGLGNTSGILKHISECVNDDISRDN